MTYPELQALVQKRANEAYSAKCAAAKLKPSKRAAAMDKYYALGGAVDLAVCILGENIPAIEAEERIKALFVHAICDY